MHLIDYSPFDGCQTEYRWSRDFFPNSEEGELDYLKAEKLRERCKDIVTEYHKYEGFWDQHQCVYGCTSKDGSLIMFGAMLFSIIPCIPLVTCMPTSIAVTVFGGGVASWLGCASANLLCGATGKSRECLYPTAEVLKKCDLEKPWKAGHPVRAEKVLEQQRKIDDFLRNCIPMYCIDNVVSNEVAIRIISQSVQNYTTVEQYVYPANKLYLAISQIECLGNQCQLKNDWDQLKNSVILWKNNELENSVSEQCTKIEQIFLQYIDIFVSKLGLGEKLESINLVNCNLRKMTGIAENLNSIIKETEPLQAKVMKDWLRHYSEFFPSQSKVD